MMPNSTTSHGIVRQRRADPMQPTIISSAPRPVSGTGQASDTDEVMICSAPFFPATVPAKKGSQT